LLDELWGRGTNDDKNVILRKGPHVLKSALGPGQARREEIVEVGLDGKVPRGVKGRRRTKAKRDVRLPPPTRLHFLALPLVR